MTDTVMAYAAKQRASLKKFFKTRPAIAIALIWVVLLFGLRVFVVATLHQPGNPELNIDIPTKIVGSIKWDGVYYYQIAQNGYSLQSNHGVFYPLFPLLVRALHSLGFEYGVAGLIINAIAIGFLCHGLYTLSLIITKKPRSSLLAVLVLLAFPSAHFFVAFYAEALFAALSVWSLVFILKRQYLAAATLAALASATRSVGLILGIVLAYQYMADRGWSWRKIDWKIMAIPLSFAGIAAYWFWLYRKTNTLPWIYFSSLYGKYWSYMAFEPNIIKTLWREVSLYPRLINSTEWADLWVNEIFTKLHFFLAWLGIVWASVLSWQKKLPFALTLYAGLTALILVLTGNFVSHSRYILPVFPFFILVAMWLEKKPEWVRTTYFIASALGLGIMLALFSNGFWVG